MQHPTIHGLGGCLSVSICRRQRKSNHHGCYLLSRKLHSSCSRSYRPCITCLPISARSLFLRCSILHPLRPMGIWRSVNIDRICYPRHDQRNPWGVVLWVRELERRNGLSSLPVEECAFRKRGFFWVFVLSCVLLGCELYTDSLGREVRRKRVLGKTLTIPHGPTRSMNILR